MISSTFKTELLAWYQAHRREFPWRQNRDPYRIWISETMLQQTTTTAVIPYFERFVARFPTLSDLAAAQLEDVFEAWAGLGYYSRAKNLHRAALALAKLGAFPRTHDELAELPGFGPYTSRAVASLAFDQSVGVVDGNTIRVISRWSAENWEWWKPKVRAQIQTQADAWVKDVSSYEMNQALMELGRTLCTPKSPTCLLCPIRSGCQAFAQGNATMFPVTKPRREREIWIWNPSVILKGGRVFLSDQQQNLPFLKGSWMPPGEARKVKHKPARFDYKHTVTHHDIYVTVEHDAGAPKVKGRWIPMDEISRYVPASLVQKALTHARPSVSF